MAARDLAIYEKQILEGILESLYGHQGFSNLRKAGPLGVFSSLYLAISYEKQILGGCILLGVLVESSVLVSNSMDSSPLSILEPLKLDEKQLHVNIFPFKYLAVFIVKH